MHAEKEELTKQFKAKLKQIDKKYPLAHISEEAIKEVTDAWPKETEPDRDSDNGKKEPKGPNKSPPSPEQIEAKKQKMAAAKAAQEAKAKAA